VKSVIDLSSLDILSLIGRDTKLKRLAGTNNGEYAGPCPFCGGHDRLRVWPHHPSRRGRFWCRVCGRKGDAIDYVRERDGVSFEQAVVMLGLRDGNCISHNTDEPAVHRGTRTPNSSPPTASWKERAAGFVGECRSHLWAPEGERALSWLWGRGLSEKVIGEAQLGYNPLDRWDRADHWGLQGERTNPVWLPRGIVIPWHFEGAIWRVNIRRPLTWKQVKGRESKYVQAAGGRNGLYNADLLASARPVLLCEGELDALTVLQHAGDLVVPVATGSTGGSRCTRWLARLALSPVVLVAYDADVPGEKAAHYWLEILPQAKRWRPFWEDANAMAQGGIDIRAWVMAGL